MKYIVPISIIFFAIMLRLLPHPANVAPIAAMALFGGVYLNRKYALVVPLLALFISDVFLGFHMTMPFVYASFLLTGVIGLWIKNHKTPLIVFSGAILSSVLFYVITNFGVWFLSPVYSKDIQGILECYILALPFFRNTLLGDMFYTGVFFGSFELVRRLVHNYGNLYTNRG